MAFRLDSRRNVGKQVRKVAGKQLDKALDALDRRAARSQDEAVHTARKRLKEVRALLRLVRDDLGRKTFDRDNKALRDAARPLSEVRDATALIDALRSLERHYAAEIKRSAFRPVRKALQSRRTEMRRRIFKKKDAMAEASSAVKKIQDRVDEWDVHRGAWPAVESGLRRSYKKGRKAMRAAFDQRSDENLHEWRKRTKDMRYQLELLEPLKTRRIKPLAKRADKLSELLGDDHDLAVLRGLLDNEFKKFVPDEAAEVLRALIDRRRLELQNSAVSLSKKLFAESPVKKVA